GLLDEYVVQAPGTHMEHDHDEHGRPTVLRHRVSVAVTAVFTDASVLGERVSEWALRPPLEIGWVDWQLTDATHRELEESALTEAVADARRRAQVMATAAGASEVRGLEVADPGLLSGGEAAQDSGVRFARAYAANGGHSGDGFAVVPEDVTVEAAVDVRCEA
ncbi:SIMPL domain-containing protein, partial [Micrococcus lylae]|uniref:SIMPL domain-containing protein n=1 Tax=Micrococcus lylae TaxID=1273 RepID=UPI003EC1084D